MRRAAGLALLGLLLLAASFLPWSASGQAGEAATSSALTTDPAAYGRALFAAKGCASCHRHAAVRTAEGGDVGPTLTDYQPDPEFVRNWLRDPKAIRPETMMPNLGLSEAEIDALIAFLSVEE